ncbi:MAG: hypothetical protein JXX29_19380 [Deltaproteobacteria bacterium]|nr:hypothetical protein [Deltaproteobacteria bacterium]MBN2673851.1 hypothetical protein [Deltaproteobacteria bacterium]
MKNKQKMSWTIWMLALIAGFCSVGISRLAKSKVAVAVNSVTHMCMGQLNLDFSSSATEREDVASFSGLPGVHPCNVSPLPIEAEIISERVFVAVIDGGAYRMSGYLFHGDKSFEPSRFISDLSLRGFEIARTPDSAVTGYSFWKHESGEYQLVQTSLGGTFHMLWIIFKNGGEPR